MNRLRLSLAILIALGFCGPATAKPVPPADPASRDRAAPPAPARFDRVGAAARLERIAELVARSNAPNLVGEQRWNELLSTFRPGLIGCSTHRQFAVVVNKLLHRAGVSHFRYYTDADWSYWHLRAAFGNSPAARRVAYIGLFPQRINNRWFVRGILEGTPADGSAIGVGDEILSVNGEPYSPIRSFEGTAGKPTTITLARTPGAAYSVTLTPATGSLYEAMQNASRESIRVVEHDGLRMAYLHGWTLLGSGGEYDLLAALQDDVDGLLLDYRDGFGGTWFVASRFLLGRSGSGVPGGDARWNKPVVILTGRGTRSAKEIVVDAVKKAGRAPLVGTPTPGAVTSVGSFRRVGADGILMLPGIMFELEGHPTRPDHPVERDIRYCRGADPQMVKAKDVLASLILNAR